MNITLHNKGYEILQILVGGIVPLLHSTVVLIKKKDSLILIDSGYVTDRELLIENLKSLDVRPSDIDHLILTHFHFDHCGNLNLFQQAQLYIGVEDYILCEKIYNCLNNRHRLTDIIVEGFNCQDEHKIRALINLHKNNASLLKFVLDKRKTLSLIDQDMVQFDTQISIKKTPGHTEGHISVICHLEEVGKVCITGDALPVNNFITEEKGFIHQDENKFFQTKQQLIADSDVIIPGHDKLFYV